RKASRRGSVSAGLPEPRNPMRNTFGRLRRSVGVVPGPWDFVLDGPRGRGVHKDHPALFVMSGESFNLDTQEDAAQEGGAQAPQQRGSLKPSILAPTWLARFETPSAHGRGGVPSSLTLLPRRAYTFSGFRPFAAPESSDRSGVTPRFGDSDGREDRPGTFNSRRSPRPLHRLPGAQAHHRPHARRRGNARQEHRRRGPAGRGPGTHRRRGQAARG